MTTEAAVVTGGARGIGGACALRLAEAGYEVAIWDVDDEAARAMVAEITDRGGRARSAVIDVADERAVAAAVSSRGRVPERLPGAWRSRR